METPLGPEYILSAYMDPSPKTLHLTLVERFRGVGLRVGNWKKKWNNETGAGLISYEGSIWGLHVGPD